jgi:uncharacterized membrane protein
MKWILLAILVAATVAADLLQSREMKTAAAENEDMDGNWRILRLIATRRYLVMAILSMAISFFAFLALVQIEPISFVIPASSASFVIEIILARFVLKERLTTRRALGALLVSGGIILVAR